MYVPSLKRQKYPGHRGQTYSGAEDGAIERPLQVYNRSGGNSIQASLHHIKKETLPQCGNTNAH